MSWSEVDKIRDKSRQRDRDPMQKQSSPAAMAAQKSYRAALERAFESGKLGELAKTLTRTEEPRAPTTGGGSTAAAPPVVANGSGVTAAPAAPTNGGADIGHAPLPQMPPPAPRDPERENRQKMLVKIKESEGRDPITRAVDAFLARYPKLPDDFEVLTKALAHKDDDRVRLALEQLTTMLAREKPRRGRTLAAQLRFLEDTHGDPDVRRGAAEVRAKL